MGKKKRKIKISRYISIEGERERKFFNFLCSLYNPKENDINIQTNSKITGGTSDSILEQAIKECNNRDKCFAWFDEDVSLSKNTRNILNGKWCCEIDKNTKDKDLQKTYNSELKNPILIVSSPCSVEGLLIRLFGKNIPENPTTDKLKNAFDGILGGQPEEEYYKEHLTKEILGSKRKEIYELDLLLKIFEK